MPKRARTYWKGFLRLSLVSIAVEVYNAVESKSEISFRQIHKPSGRRVNYQKVVHGIGEIDSADIVKGYEVEPDTYVTLEPEEIDAVKIESRKTIDLVQFVDAKDIQSGAFKIVVERSIVYLMGIVTEREADRASQLAASVSGVQKVVRVMEIVSEADLAGMQPPAKAASQP